MRLAIFFKKKLTLRRKNLWGPGIRGNPRFRPKYVDATKTNLAI